MIENWWETPKKWPKNSGEAKKPLNYKNWSKTLKDARKSMETTKNTKINGRKKKQKIGQRIVEKSIKAMKICLTPKMMPKNSGITQNSKIVKTNVKWSEKFEKGKLSLTVLITKCCQKNSGNIEETS